jgi:hypothetical protein
MKLWFLRFSDQSIDRAEVVEARLAPVLFRNIPLAECSLQLSELEIRELVAKYYTDPENSAASRGQYSGALIRFLTEVQVGDVVAICLNRGPDLLYGEVLDGELGEFPRVQNSKARPLRWLQPQEIAKIEAVKVSSKVTKYNGTICFWEDLDFLDEDEKKKQTFYSKPQPGKQIKFIRVGVDLGCGGRLSRLFPQNYYHFITIPQHNDPEFCRFTYGDVNAATKFHSLLTLRKDDILVFYGGFETGLGVQLRRLVGIFAYFIVQELYVIDRNPGKQLAIKAATHPRGTRLVQQFCTLADKPTFQEMIAYCGDYNEHATIRVSGALNLIVCGDRRQSRLLEKVEFLANATGTGKYILDHRTAAKWGLKPNADLTRCSVRTADPVAVSKIAERLCSLP